MKKILLVFTALLISVSFISCGEKDGTTTGKDSTEVSKKDSEPRFHNMKITRTHDNCEIGSDSCTYIQIMYPMFESGKAKDVINTFIDTTLLRNVYGMGDTTYSSLEAMANAFISDFADFRKEFSDTPYNMWYSKSDMKVAKTTRNIYNMEFTLEAFTGGAHGMYLDYFYTLDKETGKQLMLKDLLAPGFETKLNTLVDMSFRKEKGIGPDEPLTGEKGGLFDNKIEYNENFQVTDDGITFVYNQYEIAPYSTGVIKVPVTFQSMGQMVPPNSPLKK